MPLFQIKWMSEVEFVHAKDFETAIKKWRDANNPTKDGVEQPRSITVIADDDEILL